MDFKVVLLGNQGVGKTSLVLRYVNDQFSEQLPSTVGAFFLTKKLVVDGVNIRQQIWDTAGQERFRSMAPLYYRAASAAILVYDVADKESFDAVDEWINELRSNVSNPIVIAIVGNKIDLGNVIISEEELQSYAQRVGALYATTSAKTAEGVMMVFQQITEQVMQLRSNTTLPSLARGIPEQNSKSCCKF